LPKKDVAIKSESLNAIILSIHKYIQKVLAIILSLIYIAFVSQRRPMGDIANIDFGGCAPAIPSTLPLAVSPPAWEMLAVIRNMPWGNESILLGTHPESDKRAFSYPLGSYGFGKRFMIKRLITKLPISFHVHPESQLAPILWVLKNEPLVRKPDLAWELGDVADPRAKTECFFVLDADEHAVFYSGWNQEEIRRLQGVLLLDGVERSSRAAVLAGYSRGIRLSDLVFERANPVLRKMRADTRGLQLDPAWSELERRFADQYDSLVGRWLDFVIAMRPSTSPATLTCILFLFALAALEGWLADSKGRPEMERLKSVLFAANQECASTDDVPESASGDSPLCDFFGSAGPLHKGTVITIPPGVPHGAGAGLHLIEFSQNSLTTLRYFDYGRNRRLHAVLACIAMADVDGTIKSTVLDPPFADTPTQIFIDGTQFVVSRLAGAGTIQLQPGSAHVIASLSGDLILSQEPGVAFRRVPEGHAAVIPGDPGPRCHWISSASSDWLHIRVLDHDETTAA
jgi:mannose-6-phosphate isomerase class I